MVKQASYRVAIILLAAGASRRLGSPKQLLPYRGRSLLHHAVEVALASALGPVFVVLGASAEQLKPVLQALPVKIVENPGWAEGIGASIRAGMKSVQNLGDLEAVLLMVCDQPFVTPELLQRLVETQRVTGKRLVACEYDNTLGVPALFDHTFFPALQSLQGDQGAKSILIQWEQEVARLPFPEGRWDIDTREDYQAVEEASRSFLPAVPSEEFEKVEKKWLGRSK